MTTAYAGVVRSDGEPADPFDVGAGHVDANRAIDPGLVYETDFATSPRISAGCSSRRFPTATARRSRAAGFPSEPQNVNLPSIAVAELITGDSVTRRVTNFGPARELSARSVHAPQSVDVTVEPPTLVLGTGQTAEFSVRFVDRGATARSLGFGELSWVDAGHTVVSPIAVQPVTLRAQRELRVRGSSGNSALPVAFGYSGQYSAGLPRPARAVSRRRDGPSAARLRRRRSDQQLHVPRSTTASRCTASTCRPNQLYLRVALFDEFTDGEDDLDLYLFFCPTAQRLHADRPERRLHVGRGDQRHVSASPAYTSRSCTGSRRIRSRAAPARATLCSRGRSA